MDYISRDDALKSICEYCSEKGMCEDANMHCAEYADIKAIPAADVAPVRRMEWKQGFGFPKYCSECGFMKHIAEKREYNFCPNCGAKME